MQVETLDYRNGKYQGPVSDQRRRHGLGIFIDDDLTFYASNWKQNKLHGQTLLYISHGKYIYGEWKDNVLCGLAVFRCGDTVLVGEFANNYPKGRCILIFERFNFVCVLEQASHDWAIVDSGTITNHKMLLKYIQKLGVAVPDHYFSLTKFVCNFTLNNNYLKTFPCYVGCCYFGFVNGLAIVFNCNNGLVAIGKHTNEEVTEFGGKFENSRSGCEGNFQLGGERVNYVGARPINQIYPIFQKLHMKSLSFINEYFDSKIKIFSNVEGLLRAQLKKITEECKAKYSFSGDLNDSLDYQEYNEEESFKLNENRGIMYQAPELTKRNSDASTPKKYLQNSTLTPKTIKENVERADGATRYFRKNSQKLRQVEHMKVSIQKTVCSETQPPELHPQVESPCVYLAKRSPFRAQKEKLPQQITTSNISIKKEPLSAYKENHTEQKEDKSRVKERTKHNNLRYLANYPPDYQNDTSSPKAKTNSVYREAPKKQESPESFKLPTFKALGEEIQQQSRAKVIRNPQKQTALHHLPAREEPTIQPIKSKTKGESFKPAKPIYEDIEERRKRILRQYKQINDRQAYNEPQPVQQYQSPYNGIVFSISKDEVQENAAFMPLTITHKHNEKITTTQPRIDIKNTGQFTGKENPANKKKVDERMYAKQLSKKHTHFGESQDEISSTSYQNYAKEVTVRPNAMREADRYGIGAQLPAKKVDNFVRDSPRKQRKSYQYLYE